MLINVTVPGIMARAFNLSMQEAEAEVEAEAGGSM